MSIRFLFLLINGIILAGIIHISIILLIPNYGSRDAWNIISARSDMWAFRKFADGDEITRALEDTDPYLRMGACTFNLKEAGLQLTGGKSTQFWSLSVFDQDGTVIYSLNNRTAIFGRLDLVVLNPVQMIGLRKDPPIDIERSVLVEADIDNGFVVLRQFQSDYSSKTSVDSFMDSASCEKYAS